MLDESDAIYSLLIDGEIQSRCFVWIILYFLSVPISWICQPQSIKERKFTKRLEYCAFAYAAFHSVWIVTGVVGVMFDIFGWGIVETWRWFYPASLAYFLVDTLVYVIPTKDTVIGVHHLCMILGHCCSCNAGPICVYLSALSYGVEVSNPFLHLRYFAKVYQSSTLMWIGGLGMVTVYPVSRLIYFPWSYFEGYMNLETVCSRSILGCYSFHPGMIFVFLMSTYYMKIIVTNPKAMFYLKGKKKEQ